jgi:FkbM family methyltransferase
MVRVLVRLLILLLKAKRKLVYTVDPGLRPNACFPRELGSILGADGLEAIDVGGAGDLQPHWYKLVGPARFTIFEPHPDSYRALVEKYRPHVEAGRFRILNVGLSGKGGKRTLYMTNTPTGSSIVRFNEKSAYLSPTDGYVFPLRETPIETETLDGSLSRSSVTDADLVKLDIQGAELEVLESLGRDRIGRLLAVELEVHLNDFYSDGAKLHDVAKFIDDHGFELLDVRVARDYIQRNGMTESLKRALATGAWSPSVSAKAWEFDVVFFRRPSPLLAAKDARAIRKLIACYCVYNFFLEAHGLAEEAASAGIIGIEERDRIQGSIRRMKASLDTELGPYRAISGAQDDAYWGQYMWVRHPTT